MVMELGWNSKYNTDVNVILFTKSAVEMQKRNHRVRTLLIVALWRNGYSFRFPSERIWVRFVCCCVKPLATIFILYCSSSLSCMNECIAIYSGGYLCTNSFRALITPCLCSSENEGSKVCFGQSWWLVLRYIITYLYLILLYKQMYF